MKWGRAYAMNHYLCHRLIPCEVYCPSVKKKLDFAVTASDILFSCNMTHYKGILGWNHFLGAFMADFQIWPKWQKNEKREGINWIEKNAH